MLPSGARRRLLGPAAGESFPQYAYAEDPEGDHFFAPPSPLVSELAKVIEQGLARGAQGGAAEGGGGGGA